MGQAAAVTPIGHDSPASFWRLLGWRHRGFRATSRGRALAGLLLVLTPFIALDVARLFRLGMSNYADLLTFYIAADDFQQHPDAGIYARQPLYIYPPVFLVLFSPIANLPHLYAGLVFEGLKWAALVGCACCAWRLCCPPGEDLPPLAALASLAIAGRFFQNDYSYGNINVFILCAVLAAAWLLLRRRPLLAGLLVGLAASVKVTPALVLVYFAYKRWWTALAGGILAVAVTTFVVPSLWLGWKGNLATLSAWNEHLVAGFVSRGEVSSSFHNQSITGVLNRVFGHSLAVRPDVYVTLVDLPPAARNAIRLGLSAAVVAALAWACRRRLDPVAQPVRLGAELSLVLIAMLLLSGYSWKGHYVSTLLPLALLCGCWIDARRPAAARAWCLACLIIAVALCVLTSSTLTGGFAYYAESYGAILLMGLVIAAGVWAAELRPSGGLGAGRRP